MPLGDDCTKYLKKQLKSPPRFTWIDIFLLTYLFFGIVVVGVGLYNARTIIPRILARVEARDPPVHQERHMFSGDVTVERQLFEMVKRRASLLRNRLYAIVDTGRWYVGRMTNTLDVDFSDMALSTEEGRSHRMIGQ